MSRRKRRFENRNLSGPFFAFIMCAPLVLEPFFWLKPHRQVSCVRHGSASRWRCRGEYAGILNLGQGLFFGAGAYMLAIVAQARQARRACSRARTRPGAGFHAVERGGRDRPTELCCINKASFPVACRSSISGSAVFMGSSACRWRLPRSSEPSCFFGKAHRRACSFPIITLRAGAAGAFSWVIDGTAHYQRLFKRADRSGAGSKIGGIRISTPTSYRPIISSPSRCALVLARAGPPCLVENPRRPHSAGNPRTTRIVPATLGFDVPRLSDLLLSRLSAGDRRVWPECFTSVVVGSSASPTFMDLNVSITHGGLGPRSAARFVDPRRLYRPPS